MARLRRSDPSRPGITRRKAGKGFTYRTPDGARLTEAETLDRIRALVIPPAWTEVWICPWPNGHIQAMGTDAKGRRQYRYHDKWRERRDAEKFEHMLVFARALPKLRRVVQRHLGDEGITRDRVLAAATRLLDLGFFRIGTEGYAEENNSFGLATMRKKHVSVDGDEVTFDFPAKSGQRRIQSVVDANVAELVGTLKERRGGGYELLAYETEDGWADVRSTDINAYLKEHTTEEISAKDFRTWHATVLCAVSLATAPLASSRTASKRHVSAAIKTVADYLGNTPAVCRNSYVDPRIIDQFQSGSSLEVAASGSGPRVRARLEKAVIELLTDSIDDEAAA